MFVTGRGGYSLARPRPYTGPGGVFHQQKKSVCVICISAHPASSGCVLWDNFFEVM